MSGLNHIGEGLESVLQRLGVPRAVELDKLVAEWPQLAGEPWASRSRPAGFEGGELLVEVPDGAVATLLGYQTAALLGRLAGRLGPGLVDRVRIRVIRPKKASDLGKHPDDVRG
jgi:predicted nucleic acid-binding Zn ribbon protein